MGTRWCKKCDCCETKVGAWDKVKKRQKASSKENLELNWQQILADELHKPVRRNFARRRVITNGIDQIWAADLVEMGKFSKWNNGVKYLLMVIDVFSKFGWIEPLLNKKGETIVKAFKNILKTGRKPKFIWCDKGREFYNQDFKKLLDENGISLYSTENEEKSSVVERWNRTMKARMWKMFTATNSTVYIDKLPALLANYNKTKHSSIGMSPEKASERKNENVVYLKLYGKEISKNKSPKFKVGDKVRISKYKRKVFDKGYTSNWTEEVFVVDKIRYTNPVTYKIKDLDNEEILGTFYGSELMLAKQEIFRIEKVLRRDKKNKRAFVKWKGYPDKFNSWVPLDTLNQI